MCDKEGFATCCHGRISDNNCDLLIDNDIEITISVFALMGILHSVLKFVVEVKMPIFGSLVTILSKGVSQKYFLHKDRQTAVHWVHYILHFCSLIRGIDGRKNSEPSSQ